jgi:hypothetical protein
MRWRYTHFSTLASIALVGSMLLTAHPAHACKSNPAPKARLATGYAKGAISAAALVRITSAAYTGKATADAHPWEATATVTLILHGDYPHETVRFERGFGSAACDNKDSPPRLGEHWVIYFWKYAEGDQGVWQAYPADVAIEADPSIRWR